MTFTFLCKCMVLWILRLYLKKYIILSNSNETIQHCPLDWEGTRLGYFAWWQSNKLPSFLLLALHLATMLILAILLGSHQQQNWCLKHCWFLHLAKILLLAILARFVSSKIHSYKCTILIHCTMFLSLVPFWFIEFSN